MRRTFTRHLNRLVPERVSDGAGGFERIWTERGSLWGDVQARTGTLRVTELGEEPRLKVKITAHALPQDHEGRPWQGDRLVDGLRAYEVEAVHEDDRRGRWLTIYAREVTEGSRP
ncbi:head-tail adaptor protein [Jannaschia aquimarina]|uniref:Phage head-tail joining protein n=1 Tax=Jannaschia aquimarina TaxID=935700 RepID=A0A0D1EI49_9RHOB|nr:head-tail adaptor protein [Jannaschia aquimarina]KIT17289.1 Phage head-tail joining protein [Jannaschia aquimarina]SNT19720.1 Phage head-tail joining protein [Jannaschia aquimarina]